MQEIPFSAALAIAGNYHTDAEIARKIGTHRQTVNGWWGMSTEPHRRPYLLAFWDWFHSELLPKHLHDTNPQTISQKLEESIDFLLSKYGKNWRGEIPLNQEWKSFPEWFVLNRLPWLCYDHFYWPNNRSNAMIEENYYGFKPSNPFPSVEEIIDEAISQAL